MNAVAFDTLKTARALESKGFSRQQSEGLAEQLAEGRTVDLSDLATRDELKAEVTKLATKEELRAEVAKLATKEELKAEIAGVRTDIAELKADMLKVIISAVVLNGALIVGGMLGVAKLLGH